MSKVPSPYERLGITPVVIEDKADKLTSKDLKKQLNKKNLSKPKPKSPKPNPNKKTAPSHQKYDPSYHPQAAIDYLSKGYPVRTLAAEFQVSTESISRWRLNNPEFEDAVKKGQAKTEKFYVDLALDLASGKKKGAIAAAIFLMKNICGYRDLPAEKQDTSQPITINFGIAPKPDEPKPDGDK